MSGKGKYVWGDGRVFVGEWKNNTMHGKGLYTWADGRKYIGEYVNDKKQGVVHGRARIIRTNGEVYDGEWFDG